MKILFISRWYPNEADPQLGVFVEKHAKAVSIFAETYVIAAFPGETYGKKFRINSMTSGNLHQIVMYYREAHPFCNLIRYFRALNIALKIMCKESGKPDIIHAHILLKPFLFAYMLSWLWNIPFFISDHWTGYVNGGFERKSVLYRRLARFLVKHARGVSLVSPALKIAFEKSGLQNNDIRIIPNVVSYPPEIINTRHKGPLKILTVADLTDKNKNISGTLKVLDLIYDKLPEFQYFIIGGGPDEILLKEMASGLKNISEKVIFIGRVPNEKVFGFLLSSDFLIVNSRVETFSVITAEAIACGLPVIATISGGPEYLVNSGNGILFPADDEKALSNAIIEMLDKYKSFDHEAMRKSIEEKFSAQVIADQFKKFYMDHLKLL